VDRSSDIAPFCVNHYTYVKQPISQGSCNAFHMREPPTRPVARYGKNLKFLIDTGEKGVADVAKAIGKPPKQVYNFINGAHDPRLKGLEKVANVFGLSAWQMLAIDFTEKPVDYKQVLALLELYSSADEAGRKAILGVAQIAAQKPSR
jgi:transcriptional regulator with XRE-family HTH domain